MKKYIILLFFIPICTSNAQNWFPNDAEWRYYYWNFETRIGYVQINVEGEEIKNGIVCKKLHNVRHLENPTIFPPPAWTEDLGYEYVYEANNGNEIFIFANNQFYKLYDFNANVGDNWTVPNTNNDISCTPNTGIVTVTNTGIETISGQTLKWIELSTNSGSGARIFGRIYQYIGAIDTYFFPDIYPDSTECMVPSDALMAAYILCYNDNLLGYGNCPPTILNTENFNATNGPTIYMENTYLIVNTNEIANLTIKIYNLAGQLINQNEILSNNIKIDTSTYSKGVYLLNIKINNKEVAKKIII